MVIPDDCLYYLVSRSTLVVTTALRRELASAGVGCVKPAYLSVLLALWQEDDQQTAALGRRAGLEPSSMTGLLDRMERDQLIRRDPDPKDRRAHRVRLTPKGAEVQKPVIDVVQGLLSSVTDGVTQEQLEVTKQALRTVLDNAQRDGRQR